MAALPPIRDDRDASNADADLIDQLRARLGLSEPLTYSVVELPVAQLAITSAVTHKMLADARALANSMQLSGLLHPPAVVPFEQSNPTGQDGQAGPTDGVAGSMTRYAVWFGKRRSLAAKLLEEAGYSAWERIPCHLYILPDPASVKRMRALLTLTENLVRSERWVEELRALVDFLANGVLLSDREMWSALGIEPQRFKALVRLARLPRQILDQVFAGQIRSESLLQKIATRLDKSQVAALVARAGAGELITAELVDRAWRTRLDAALATSALQAALGQGWGWENAKNAGPIGTLPPPIAELPRSDRRSPPPSAASEASLGAPLAPRMPEALDAPGTLGTPATRVAATQAIHADAGDAEGQAGSPHVMSSPLTPSSAAVPSAGAAGAASASSASNVDDAVSVEPIAHLLYTLQQALPALRGDPRFGQAALFAEALAHELEPHVVPPLPDGSSRAH